MAIVLVGNKVVGDVGGAVSGGPVSDGPVGEVVDVGVVVVVITVLSRRITVNSILPAGLNSPEPTILPSL